MLFRSTAGTTVLTGTSTDSTVAGDYDVVVGLLARANSQSGISAPTADLALGKSGTYWLGGTGLASVTGFSASTSVTDATTGTVADGQRELGSTGTIAAEAYSLQVRDSGGVRQFRLVNADGTAMSIRNQGGTDFTSSWQAMSDGSYDTGRGQIGRAHV